MVAEQPEAVSRQGESRLITHGESQSGQQSEEHAGAEFGGRCRTMQPQGPGCEEHQEISRSHLCREMDMQVNLEAEK